MITAADGQADRGRSLLATALAEASDWIEVPVLAAVIDAVAVLASRDGGHGELAASLLGAAHTIRGCFDEASLDAPAARDGLRARLGPEAFQAAYDRGRALSREETLAQAAGVVAGTAGQSAGSKSAEVPS